MLFFSLFTNNSECLFVCFPLLFLVICELTHITNTGRHIRLHLNAQIQYFDVWLFFYLFIWLFCGITACHRCCSSVIICFLWLPKQLACWPQTPGSGRGRNQDRRERGRSSLGKSAEQERINTAQEPWERTQLLPLTGLLEYSADSHTHKPTSPAASNQLASVKIHKFQTLLVGGTGHLWAKRRSFLFWDLTVVYIKAVLKMLI